MVTPIAACVTVIMSYIIIPLCILFMHFDGV